MKSLQKRTLVHFRHSNLKWSLVLPVTCGEGRSKIQLLCPATFPTVFSSSLFNPVLPFMKDLGVLSSSSRENVTSSRPVEIFVTACLV